MKVLHWHVHGSWSTSFVAGAHDYVVPLLPDRSADGGGRARSWDWPASAREVPADQLRDEPLDVVVLQRPHELELVERWTGRRPGHDLPAVYLEHNAPTGHAVRSRHPVADRDDIPVVHVTWFNQMAWDCGRAPTSVVEHGIIDPGHRYTGERASLAAVVNEPVRRWRVAGTDLLLRIAGELDVDVHGIDSHLLPAAAAEHGVDLPATRVHNLSQQELHDRIASHRAYLHPYRWTSLGLSLLEAMMLGMPVLALATTEHPRAVPDGAGLVSNDLEELLATARRWMDDPEEARAAGLVAREHALGHYGIDRFLADWDRVLAQAAR
ncbi:glycosyltransferase [Desertihabitans aurantiacus]|uniref:glycosyltransferase n=1 Tax=Desertihabitans aurantiacus TaxID=2282477 RepID=UPI000DF72495|nr:glycosyltransferase [Desertihabitans aurantiacus]